MDRQNLIQSRARLPLLFETQTAAHAFFEFPPYPTLDCIVPSMPVRTFGSGYLSFRLSLTGGGPARPCRGS
jgi:hypothetical protein